jgi:hypothetical protein
MVLPGRAQAKSGLSICLLIRDLGMRAPNAR